MAVVVPPTSPTKNRNKASLKPTERVYHKALYTNSIRAAVPTSSPSLAAAAPPLEVLDQDVEVAVARLQLLLGGVPVGVVQDHQKMILIKDQNQLQ